MVLIRRIGPKHTMVSKLVPLAPALRVSENTIKIVLPVFEKNLNLTENEQTVYKFLSKTMLKPISEIAPMSPLEDQRQRSF